MTDKMKNVWKHIINITFAAVLVCVLTAAFCLGVSSRKGIRCKGVTITVTDSATNQFITPKEIRKFLDEEYTGYIGEPIDSIDLTRIEKILDSKSAILKSQAFTTKDSLLNIIVTQRKPVVRFQKGKGGFYADAEGHLFPLQNTYASHVLIVDGRIPLKLEYGYTGKLENDYEKKWLKDMVTMVNHIEASRTWKDKIVQITVGEGGELMLIPREGKEKFLFGQPDDLKGKFERMETYYKSVRKDKGEDYYSFVDVRFEGQLVCR